MDLKVGVVFFHSDIRNIYKERWIAKSITSMKNQTVKNLHFYEISYGENQKSILSEYSVENLKFYHKNFNNYAEAMNFIISEAFSDGCDYVFNTNMDDFYRQDRVEKELELIQSGYDIVSSDFCYVKEFIHENGAEEDRIFRYMRIWKRPEDIVHYFNNGDNIFPHPSVCYSRNFWENNKYDVSKVPEEDFHLWKKSIRKGYKFAIHPEVLLYYRRHENQVSIKK